MTATEDASVQDLDVVIVGAGLSGLWYLGDNIPGKVRVFLPYVAGLPSYIEHCERIVAADYEGFVFS